MSFNIKNNRYRIYEALRKQYLTVDDSNNVCTAEDAEVIWVVQKHDNSGDYTITEENTGKVLDASGGQGPNVIIYNSNVPQSPNQRWYLTETGDSDNSQYIMSKAVSGSTVVSDPGNAHMANVYLARKGDETNEKWVFVSQ